LVICTQRRSSAGNVRTPNGNYAAALRGARAEGADINMELCETYYDITKCRFKNNLTEKVRDAAYKILDSYLKEPLDDDAYRGIYVDMNAGMRNLSIETKAQIVTDMVMLDKTTEIRITIMPKYSIERLTVNIQIA
jgi:hypothetical protein